jgi:hypothetical protein
MYFGFLVFAASGSWGGNAGVWLWLICPPWANPACSTSFLKMISATWSPTDSSLSSLLKACFLKDSTISFLSMQTVGFLLLSFHAEVISLWPNSMNMLTIVV